jgi:hypothetical protein
MSIPTLAECIYRICKRDLFLRRINFTNECFESFWDYEHDRERQYDSVSSGDTTDLETTNKQKLRRGDAGEMEWYEDLGQMIGQLDGLYSLHFDSLDIDREELRRFWCEVSRNRCLRFIECTNINITNGEEFLVWFWNTKISRLRFCRCEIRDDIGFVLADFEVNDNDKGIEFNMCHFPHISTNTDVIEFARGLHQIIGLNSLQFRDCTFENEETKNRFGCMMRREFNTRGFNFVFE